MPTPDDPLNVLEMIQAQSDMADVLDGLKTSLEQRGWSSGSAETASITVFGPLIVAQASASMAAEAMKNAGLGGL